jgi:Flp pilus assembly pilin Flp
MHACLTGLRLDRSATTSIEYGLIAALISLLIVGWATSIGTSVTNFFNSVANGF